MRPWSPGGPAERGSGDIGDWPSGQIRAHIFSRDGPLATHKWRTTTLQNYDQKIDLELSKADEVEHEAWEAWDSSIGKHTAVMEKEGQGGPEIITRTEVSPGDPRFPHPAPLGGSSAFIANTGRVTYRAESFAFFTFAFPWRATAVPCFFGYVIRFTSGRDQRPPPGIPPPTLRFSLSSSPESVPVHDIFISWPPT